MLSGTLWKMVGRWPDVRFGSQADICAATSDVCFTPDSGHVRLLWAKSGPWLLRSLGAWQLARSFFYETRKPPLTVVRGGQAYPFPLSAQPKITFEWLASLRGSPFAFQRRLVTKSYVFVVDFSMSYGGRGCA